MNGPVASPDPGANVSPSEGASDARPAHAAPSPDAEPLRLAFDRAPTGNALTTADGRFTRVNAKLARLLGRAEADLLDTDWTAIVRSEDQPVLADLLRRARSEEHPVTAQMRLSHVTGRPIHATVTASFVPPGPGRAAAVVVQVEDVTARRLAQAALAHQATHDALTALPNRTLLLDRLSQALQRAQRTRTHVALLFCDVDRFKRINDSLGHECGDLLLVEVGRRLRTTIRATDTAGRLGGDEFLVICEQLATPGDALVLAERVRSLTDEPIVVQGRSLAISLSIGVAHAGPGDDPGMLLRRADSAMYEAKERGRGRLEVYDERLRDRARARLQLESELRDGVSGGQLRLHHQPVVDLTTGTIVGGEALVRWEHPVRGLLDPAAFLDVAEESDLIVELGAWVLDEACRQGRTLIDRGVGSHVAVNVSARQLGRADFRRQVEAALERTGLRHDQLVLELTETALLKAAPSAMTDVEALHRQGVRLAVDDFGTGYSSLTHLQRLPVGVVKIDRSFVAEITTDPKRRAIAQAVVGLGQTLDLQVVAEGVETADQAALLADMGCRQAQGYLFGRPAPIDPPVEGAERRGAPQPVA